MRQADQQRQTTNAIGAQNNTQAQQLESQLVPGYTSMMNTGYMSPADKAAATTSEMGAATAPFSAANFSAANTAGATRNASDLTANQDQLALEQGQTAGTAAANLQNQTMQNQLAGMYGLAGQETGNQQQAMGMYGLSPALLNAGTNAVNSSMGPISAALGAGGTIGAAALKCWVAAELYGGWDVPETQLLRQWIFSTWWMTPFAALYGRFGKQWADIIKGHSRLRQGTKFLFDAFLRLARG